MAADADAVGLIFPVPRTTSWPPDFPKFQAQAAELDKEFGKAPGAVVKRTELLQELQVPDDFALQWSLETVRGDATKRGVRCIEASYEGLLEVPTLVKALQVSRKVRYVVVVVRNEAPTVSPREIRGANTLTSTMAEHHHLVVSGAEQDMLLHAATLTEAASAAPVVWCYAPQHRLPNPHTREWTAPRGIATTHYEAGMLRQCLLDGHPVEGIVSEMARFRAATEAERTRVARLLEAVATLASA